MKMYQELNLGSDFEQVKGECRVVAFIDIIDCRSEERRLSSEEYQSYLIKLHHELEKAPFVSSTSNEPIVRFAFLGNSIYIISKDSTEESISSVLKSCMKIYFSMLSVGFACKGSIVTGECCIDETRSMLSGDPFDLARKLSQTLCFYGIVMTQGSVAPQEIENSGDWIPMTCYCDVPLCDGTARGLDILNWSALMESEDDIEEALFVYDHGEEPSIQEHYSNTARIATDAYYKTHSNRLA